MQIYRVNTVSDGSFRGAIASLSLSNSLITISEGANDDYNQYVCKNVKVYGLHAQPEIIQRLNDDLRYNASTKKTYKELGNGEIYI